MNGLRKFEAPVDLHNCDREPIHLPGTIQGGGVLVAVDAQFIVRIVSENLDSMLPLAASEAVGRPLADLLGAEGAGVVAAACAGDAMDRREDLLVSIGGELHPLTLHRSGALNVIEIEEPSPREDISRLIRTAMVALQGSRRVREVADRLVTSIRAITGADRVMVYRFDAEWNGEVIAESCRGDLNRFLGLHYPATDIPAQARDLYLRNWIRSIPDVGYTPIPLHPSVSFDVGEPFDMSFSILRSVSPIHVEYLANMGVRASMSVSIVINGVLWGLIACHHYEGPLRVSPDRRRGAELIGQVGSLAIANAMTSEVDDQQAVHARTLGELSIAFARHTDLRRALVAHAREILGLVDATGALMVTDTFRQELGLVPDIDPACWKALTASTPAMVESCSVFTDFPGLTADTSNLAGIFALPLSPDWTTYIAWFRQERIQAVSWGGDPTNAKLYRNEGEHIRVSPRKSFDRWQQIVRGRSAAWEPRHRYAADLFAGHVRANLLQEQRHTATAIRTLQDVVRLESLPDLDGWELAARYAPADSGELGGDWYDVVALDDDRYGIIVGDVAGHGRTAVAEMTQIRHTLRAYLLVDADPAHALEATDRLMRASVPGSLATCVCAVLNRRNGSVVLSLAGNLPALHLRRDGVALVEQHPDPLLGLVVKRRHSVSLTLQAGEGLLLYSDGLVERRERSIDDGVRALLRQTVPVISAGGSAEDLIDAVWPDEPFDDVCVLAVRRFPELKPRG